MALKCTRGVLYVFFLILYVFVGSPQAKTKELIVVGAPYEPFLFIDRQGRPQGFDVDLINLLCTTAGYQCHIKITTFKEALESLQEGTADVAIGAIYVTEERQKKFLYTIPYFDTGLVAVTRVDNEVAVDDLSGKTIGVKLGATGEIIAQRLASEHRDLKIKRYLTTEESFEGLIRGEVDFILNDYLNSVYLILKRYTGTMVIVRGVFGPYFFQKTTLAYPIRKDLREVQQKFNQTLKSITRSGILDELKERWLGIVPGWDYPRLARTFFSVLTIIIAISILALLLVRQREIRRQAKNLKGLLRELPGAVFVIQNGRVVFSNPTAGQMFNTPTLDLPIDKILPIGQDQKELLYDPSRIKKAGRFELIHKNRVYMCHYAPIIYNKKLSVQLLIYDITAERQARESARQLYRYQEAYNTILQRCSEATSEEALLREVLDEILNIEFLSTKRAGAVFVYDEKARELKMIAHAGLPEKILRKCHTIKEGQCLCGLAIKEKRFMFIPSGAYPEYEHEEDQSHGHCFIPIFKGQKAFALFNIYIKEEHPPDSQAKGFLLSIASVVGDSLRRIRLADHLKRSMETLHLAVENMPLPVVIYTGSGAVFHANKKFKDLTGYPADAFEEFGSIAKRMFTENTREEVLPKLYDKIWTVLQGIEINTAEGTKKICNISFGPIGKVEEEENYMFVLEDITEEEALRKQLMHSQKMEAVGRLAGGVAHDFNNIIGAIMGYAELALTAIEDKETLKKHLDAIIVASQRASLLTGQLLAFSKKQMTHPRPININGTITETTRFMGRILGEDIDLVIEKAQNLPPVMADPIQIEQILLNLLINARDAMPEGGKILIKTEQIGEHVVITVSDTGIGIAEEHLDRIFEPFFTTKPEGKGTGLGLSTVYGIVQELNGKIEVSSEEHKGTTFKIFLPACKTTSEEPKPDTYIEVSQGPEDIKLKGKVVVVEDDPDVRDVLRGYLEALGAEVVVVEEPDKTTELIDEKTELLITDLVMPGINGLAIAEKAKKLFPSLKVLFITGFVADESLLKKVEETSIMVLPKPFNLKQLIEAIRRVISD